MTDWPQVPDEAVGAVVDQWHVQSESMFLDEQAREWLTAAMPHLGRAWLEWAADEAKACADSGRRSNPARAAEYETAEALLRSLAATLPTDEPERKGP